MREAGIMLISTALTCAVIGNAYYQRKQFYPTVVHITKSNPSMTVIYAQGLILVFMINAFLRKIFFGTLRAAELEHLLEKVWYAVTETCLAFTVFRDDFSPKFIALFTLLLFLKSFHWLAEDRVDYMERSPVITWLFHLRIGTLLGFLFAINLTMIHYAYNTTATKGPSVQLVFGFEYAILLTVVFNISVKYILHTIDLQSENPWDNKPVFLLYTELIIGLLRVLLYAAFVTLMIKLYTLPLFALRPMYYTMRDFKKAFHDIVMSRRAIRNMNTLYPDATAEELAAADNVCIICREEMIAASKKLPCNHIFHTACLRSWFQRQQTCPTCRLNILRPVTNNQGTRQQNQPQAGQQAHQAPQALRFNPMVRVLPAFWAGLQAPGAAPQQQAPGATPQQQDQNNAGNTASTSFQNLAAGGVPLFPPPFPTMVPLPPIPTPPPNLTELSEEELRAMEGNLRQGVEARIQTLQRVQLLLDAASAMMNQYQTAAATANIPVPTATSDTNRYVASDVSSMGQPGTSKETCSTVENEHQQVQAETNVPTTNTSSESTSTLIGTNSNDIAPESSIRNETESSSEQDMLRRRRLQKFSNQLTTE
ncbi:E3 ubiquitin-protein ligase synoviolin A [Hylaeus anthracinus]|uniref:E3 ubiquitin-protein ligase synoviolin A n=1 Tax=Hylaeus anthracinus TaxID=313031 RepID=UPI0023B93B8B|nr:E3 ubiquitin-protein ligase synoviolin A [Hylaeus anthracinus]XP_054012061.1 E3 ubiquitin-protein ligase synoviolin A [Hylaeus anthracinus]